MAGRSLQGWDGSAPNQGDVGRPRNLRRNHLRSSEVRCSPCAPLVACTCADRVIFVSTRRANLPKLGSQLGERAVRRRPLGREPAPPLNGSARPHSGAQLSHAGRWSQLTPRLTASSRPPATSPTPPHPTNTNNRRHRQPRPLNVVIYPAVRLIPYSTPAPARARPAPSGPAQS